MDQTKIKKSKFDQLNYFYKRIVIVQFFIGCFFVSLYCFMRNPTKHLYQHSEHYLNVAFYTMLGLFLGSLLIEIIVYLVLFFIFKKEQNKQKEQKNEQ